MQGLVTGLSGPVSNYFKARLDTNVDAFKTAAGVDQQAYANYLQAWVQVQQVKATQNSAPLAKFVAFATGMVALFYFGAIVFDSVVTHCHCIDKMPGQWDADAWTILESFVIVAPVAVLPSAVASWIHRK